MKHAVSNFPVGATWISVSEKDGSSCTIWLRDRQINMEAWHFAWGYSDNSGGGSNWGTSYNMVRSMVPANFKRFKRIK